MDIQVSQTVAILIDGNNMERSIHSETGDPTCMLNFDELVPRLVANRSLNRLIYFREGKSISSKLAERLHQRYHGSVRPCHKSADIPLSIKATQLANKVDTIIILSGDSDYVELVNHLKNEGVRVEIAGVESTTAGILRECADYFHPIRKSDWFSLNSLNASKAMTNKSSHQTTNHQKTSQQKTSKTKKTKSSYQKKKTTSKGR